MKIGLLTYHDTTNFGAWLQMFSLYKVMSDLGYDVEVLDYACEEIGRREMPRRLVDVRGPKQLASYFLFEPAVREKYRNMSQALRRLVAVSEKRYDRSSIAEANDCYDAFLVGSDLLWALDVNGHDMTYFLDFVEGDNRRFAFGTSVGNPWAEHDKPEVSRLLSSFSRIATREREAASWVEELYGRPVQTVCDPTMLVRRDTWDCFAKNSHMSLPPGYVLTYFNTADGSLYHDASDYACKHGLEGVAINYGRAASGLKVVRPTTLEDFIWLFANAETVFTASYHGFLFSLYFSKDVYYYCGNHGSRFDTVAKRLGIEYRKVQGDTDWDAVSPIDYDRVTPLIDDWRAESLSLLASYWPNERDAPNA